MVMLCLYQSVHAALRLLSQSGLLFNFHRGTAPWRADDTRLAAVVFEAFAECAVQMQRSFHGELVNSKLAGVSQRYYSYK